MGYVKVFSIVFLLFLLYQDVLPKLVANWWNDPNYSHGFLIPFISLYLLRQKQPELIKIYKAKEYAWSGLLFMWVALMMLAIGKAGSELFLQRFSLIVLIAGIILLLFGRNMGKACFGGLAFLVFMIPIPYILYDAIAFPLKIFATYCATTSLSILRIPVFREGNIIHLAHTTLEVADACSGIRSLLSLFALGTFLAFIALQSFRKRILLIVLVLPIAIFANSIRIIGTGILAHYYGSHVAEGFFHEFSGLLLFITVSLLLGLLCRIIATTGREASSGVREQE